MPVFPRLTMLPRYSDLVIDCRTCIAAGASQHVGRPLNAEELKKTPEQYFEGQKTQWIQKFKGVVMPRLHNNAQFAKYLRKFQYSDAYAEQAFKETFNDTAVDIAIRVFVPLEKRNVNIDALLD